MMNAIVTSYPTVESPKLEIRINAKCPEMRNNGYNEFPVDQISVDLDVSKIPNDWSWKKEGKTSPFEFTKYVPGDWKYAGRVLGVGGWVRVHFLDKSVLLHGGYDRALGILKLS